MADLRDQNAGEDPMGVTRREVLRRAGSGVAAFALAPGLGRAAALFGQSPGRTEADRPISAVMTRLSTYMSEARDRALPDDVVERAKRHILDTMAAMVSGSELAPGRAALAFARGYGGKAVATVVGDTIVCGPIEAALVNGTMAHADETDDTLAPGPWHPGCNVVPAALAVGEMAAVSGARLVRAVVLGYDVGTRVMAAIQPGLATGHKLSYGIGGVFGSAAAAASVAGLDAQQMRWALSYTAQQSSGIESFPRDPDHIEKGFIFGGMPARGGVTSVLLVQNGWTAVHDIMSGPESFVFANAPTGNAELLVDRLGERYEITRANIKKWTVGQPIHAPLDALEALLARQPIDPAQVQEIVLRYQPGSITDNSGPSDINVQHALAVMLIDKALTFRSIHDTARMHDPAVVRLREMVRLDGAAPAAGASRSPLLQILLSNGTRLTQDGTGPVLGTAANPMSREQVIAKSRDLMAPVLGAAQTGRLIDRVLAIDSVKDVRELRPLLQRARRDGPPRLSEYPRAK
jgi:2-methylcitrate dehydratase PrpD